MEFEKARLELEHEKKIAQQAKKHAAKRVGYTHVASVSATVSPSPATSYQVSVLGAATPRKSMSRAVYEPKDTALIEFAKQVITHE